MFIWNIDMMNTDVKSFLLLKERENKRKLGNRPKEPADLALLCTGSSRVGSASANLGDSRMEVFEDVSSTVESSILTSECRGYSNFTS